MSAARHPAARPVGLAPGGPNLARRPFVNQRPVKRISLLLVVAGAVLLLADLWLYFGYVSTRRSTASQLVEIEAQIESERAALEAAQGNLAAAEVGAQNELVEFMNARIAERTFGWSVLFDRLAGLLPQDVRLDSLSPQFVAAEAMRRGPGVRRAAVAEADPGRQVRLGLEGRARDGEAILTLVDALFADPAFADPDLRREARQDGEVGFSLSVTYLPRAAEELARAAQTAEEADAGEVRATPPGLDGGPDGEAAAADAEPGGAP
jgi:Tfp pilus assembly protein PilN